MRIYGQTFQPYDKAATVMLSPFDREYANNCGRKIQGGEVRKD